MRKYRYSRDSEVWLKHAMADTRVAKIFLRDDGDDEQYSAAAAFWSQRCAEKSLIAYILFREQLFEEEACLEKHLIQCVKLDKQFAALAPVIAVLSPYDAYSEDPEAMPDVDRKKAEQAIVHAQRIFDFVRNIVPEKQNSLVVDTSG